MMKEFCTKYKVQDAFLEKMINKGGWGIHFMQFMSDNTLNVVFVKECVDTPPVAAPAAATAKRITSTTKIVIIEKPAPILEHFPTVQSLREAAINEWERRYIQALDEGIARMAQASKSFTKYMGVLDD